MTKTRKLLLALLLFGVTGTAIGAGTFASFSASTTNQTSTFATGTLVLTNKVDSGSVCSSADVGVDTNSNTGCDVVFSTLTNLKPGSTPATADLTLANAGTLTPSALNYAMSACAPGNAAGTSVHGTGDPCDAVEIYVQEYDSGFNTPTDSCVFPADNDDPCEDDFSAATDALSDVPSGATTISGGLATTRYFRIGVQLGSSAGNDMQGRKADFGFTWSIEQ